MIGTMSGVANSGVDPMDWQAFFLTLKLASVTTTILLVIAVPLAAWVALGRSRWRAVVEAVTSLPLVLPPTVLGFYLLVLLGPRTWLGRTLSVMIGHPLAFSFAGLVVGSVLYSFPFAVQPLVAGFSTIDKSLIDAARLLGARPLRLIRTILIPLAARSLLTAAVLSFLHTMGEFGVVLMLGGDLPGATRTLSITLFNQVESFDYATANRTALLLVYFSAAALLLVYAKPRVFTAWLTSKPGSRSRSSSGADHD
jgi:molybdate transport system permease protein